MTLVELPSPIHLPPIFGSATSANPFATGSSTINAAGMKHAVLMRVPKTGNLDRFEFAVGAAAQIPSNGLKLSFQDPDLATGFPDGTQDQSVTVAAGALAANTWIVPGAFSASRAVTKGDYVCCVIEFVTFVAGDSIGFLRPDSRYDQGFPTEVKHNGTVWQKGTQSPGAVGFLLRYDDGSVEMVTNQIHLTGASTLTYNNGSTPDEIGNLFTLPFTCRLTGGWWRLALTAGAAFDQVLYGPDGSVISTISVDNDHMSGAAGPSVQLIFSDNPVIVGGIPYRISVKPTSATNVTIYSADFSSSAYRTPTIWNGAFQKTSRTDAGAWTEDSAKIICGGLLISHLDNAP